MVHLPSYTIHNDMGKTSCNNEVRILLGIVHRSILGDKILQQINVAHPSLHWIVCNSYLINKIKIMNTQIQLGKTLMVNLGTGSHFQKLRTRIWF